MVEIISPQCGLVNDIEVLCCGREVEGVGERVIV